MKPEPMPSERQQRIEQLYHAALERSSSDQQAFLAEACAGDEALLREVASLISAYNQAGDLIEGSPGRVAAEMLDAHGALSMFGRQISHYQLLSLLGAGGMGRVYRARDTLLDREVAIKVLPQHLADNLEALARFKTEARAVAALSHPNILAIYDFGTELGVTYAVMELLVGETLRPCLARSPLGWRRAAEYGVRLAEGLAAAHTKGIVHRDLKPENVFLTEDGQLKILDFGLARVKPPMSPQATLLSQGLTQPGMVLGTLGYMSPEQVRGKEVGAPSDAFSFGCVLYEMVTGRRAFARPTAAETIAAILKDDPHFADNIPTELNRIIRKCLEKEPARRYQSSGDLLVDLLNFKREADAQLVRMATRDAPRHNLPVQLTSLVGRLQEMDDLRGLLASTRLLTLTGAGGCGKTRLAIAVAAAPSVECSDGVWFVDLAPLSQPNLIVQSIAAVLQVREGPTGTLEEVVCEFVRKRRLLLVLDNCEHLIATCAQLAETLLRTGPDLRILATGREPLGIPGETVYRTPSLSVPSAPQTLSSEALLDYGATRLFVERARSVEPGFTVNTDNTSTIAEICGKLDGIPLAIELAAARVNVLSVEEINLLLSDRFRLLTAGSRTAAARQRTLEATLDWSYTLLQDAEQRLLCRLSVFFGGWTLQAAEAVCSDDEIQRQDILDLLSQLITKSLVNVEDDGHGNRRYRFLETVRQYGWERLLRSGSAEHWRASHAAFFFEFALGMEPKLQQAEQFLWLKRMQLEHDNLRSALDWHLSGSNDGATGLRLAVALSPFWTKCGYYAEGTRWYERALAADSGPHTEARARALVALSMLTLFQGGFDRGETLAQESLALARATGDPRAIAYSLVMLAIVDSEIRGFAENERLTAEAQAVAASASLDSILGSIMIMRAWGAYFAGNSAEGDALCEKGLVLLRATDDPWSRGMGISDLALLKAHLGLYQEAMQLSLEVLPIWQESGERRGAAWCFENLAIVAANHNQAARATRLWGASDALLENVASFLLPTQQQIRDRLQPIANNSLGEAAFQAALAEGRVMSFTRAIEYALETKA